MSLSFGSSKKKTSTTQDIDPYEPTIEPLDQLIGMISDQMGQGNIGATANQQDAFNQLFANAQSEGNPFAQDIYNLSADLFGADSRAGQIEQAYSDITKRLGDTADGKYLDVNENPYLQEMLQNNADAISQRINQQFAGAGRDLSGKNQSSLARGISEGTIPALFNQYNLERQNQANAASTLFNAGQGAAQAEQGLDQAALNQRGLGINAADAYTAARDLGPNTILALEQQLKQLGVEDLGRFEALLGPLAQLGQQMSGKSTSKGSSSGFGGSVGSLFSGLGALFSDENTKEGIEGPGSAPKRVGYLDNGLPVHVYVYKGDPTHTAQIGVMAQEAQEVRPDAVMANPDYGSLMVDYGELTNDAMDLAEMKRRNDKLRGDSYGV